MQLVGCRTFLFGTLSWRCCVLAAPVPLPQHRMPSAVLLGSGSGRRFGSAGLAFLYLAGAMWLGRCAGLVGFFGVLCCTCRVARVEALPSTAWDVCPRRVPRRRATRAQHDKCSFRICMFNLALCLFFWTWRCCAFRSGWGQDVREGLGARTFSLLCAQMLYSCISTHLMRSAGLIVLVRAFFAALQPHPRVSGAVGGVSQLSCACLPCCPPTASPRQWGRGGGSQQGWDIAAVHSLGCARAHGQTGN